MGVSASMIWLHQIPVSYFMWTGRKYTWEIMSLIQRKNETPQKIVKNVQKLKIWVTDSCISCSFSMISDVIFRRVLRSKVVNFTSFYTLFDEKSMIFGSLQTQTFRVFWFSESFIFVICFCKIHGFACIIDVGLSENPSLFKF